ncbi:ABC transporter permease [Paraflavitalea sp. CAU 1676]|uniref:ABC transporter permease n=1 Tax=Paraflavitalea sp. CAU 1676 TaxID=3032598 RepID=UPI0023DB0106|nr:ABC transporter permease [Paraflavitalea sp. CAU 1676]MDF2189948.1 ABC transporter permease [Paraflavitalea sp. CAU 1676]
MPQPYNQFRGMLAITRASLKAVFRSPSAVIFSFAFPMVFILVFGFIGGGGGINVRIAFDKKADTTSPIYTNIQKAPGIRIVNKGEKELLEDLEKGRITAILNIQKSNDSLSDYKLSFKSSGAVNPQNLEILRSIFESKVRSVDEALYGKKHTLVAIDKQVEMVPGRVYRTIDFILPGQLGFSLMSAGIFGVAFIFFNLRQTLVLKRFFATPIKRSYIILGEGLSRVIFQMITAVVILLVGHFFFKFTLIHGVLTMIELLILSFIGLIVFMGFGFVVSGVAKNESVIPPLANLFTLPQFLLAGTFFSIDNFPSWLQPLCRILPLTHMNDAMRNIAFEGAHLTDCGTQIGVLAIWGVVAYAGAVKVFKWE